MPSAGNGKPRFATLEARIDRVPDAILRKKWKKLPASSHGAARDALSIARQQARSRIGKGKTSHAAEDCVDAMLNRLNNRLLLIPYPPATDESHFDREANLNCANKVEGQLTDTQNAIRLLKTQIELEEKRLKMDETELQFLKKNNAGEEANRRNRFPHLHSAAKEISENIDGVVNLSLSPQESPSAQIAMAMLYKNSEIQPILEQLDNHLSSVSHNMASILPVSRGIGQARSELLIAINK